MQRSNHKLRRLAGFTLPELLVVMGIIIIFIALAIPAMNVLSGSRSIAAGENNLQAALVRAREEAIASQQLRGLMFTIDPGSDRVVATLVQEASPPANVPASLAFVTWLDTVPGREQLRLPPLIRLQTVFDSSSMQPLADRYLGYNPPPNGVGNAGVKVGGVILFDGDGQLVVRQYGFRLLRTDPATGIATPSGIMDMFYLQSDPGTELPIAQGNDPFVPFVTADGNVTNIPPKSQLAVVLFDQKDFNAHADSSGNAFSDLDNQSNETAKETWIDGASTPLLVNRFTGTLIRGE